MYLRARKSPRYIRVAPGGFPRAAIILKPFLFSIQPSELHLSAVEVPP